MRVWFVDDRADNRATWLASFPASMRSECEFRLFASVPALFSVLDRGERPDVLFVDYFIHEHDGLEVVERFMAEDEVPPLLIAHSSLGRVNVDLVKAGAHLAMEKVPGAQRTRSIVRSIQTTADLEALVGEHLPA